MTKSTRPSLLGEKNPSTGPCGGTARSQPGRMTRASRLSGWFRDATSPIQHRITVVPPSVLRCAVRRRASPGGQPKPYALWAWGSFDAKHFPQLRLPNQSLILDLPVISLLASQGSRWLLVGPRFPLTCARARWPRALRASRLLRRTR